MPPDLICQRCKEIVSPMVQVTLTDGTTKNRLVQCIIGPDFAEHVGTCPKWQRET